jgi:hypothetical protein
LATFYEKEKQKKNDRPTYQKTKQEIKRAAPLFVTKNDLRKKKKEKNIVEINNNKKNNITRYLKLN